MDNDIALDQIKSASTSKLCQKNIFCFREKLYTSTLPKLAKITENLWLGPYNYVVFRAV